MRERERERERKIEWKREKPNETFEKGRRRREKKFSNEVEKKASFIELKPRIAKKYDKMERFCLDSFSMSIRAQCYKKFEELLFKLLR